jgi:hypothetical protein
MALGAAIVGLIPGTAYLALFFCGVFEAVDWVGLLADRLTAWFAPIAIGGLTLSILAGLSSGAARTGQSEFRACAFLAVLLMVVDVSLMFVQLVCLFVYYD